MEENIPNLKLWAINPGYTVGDDSNVGEVIVLKNLQGGSFSLAGFSINYINSKGNKSELLDLPANAEMIGETLWLRLASSKEAADLSYSKTLALEAAVELLYNGEVIDRICWNGGDGCEAAFKGTDYKMLVRDPDSLRVNVIATADFTMEYDSERPGIKYIEEQEAEAQAHCRGLQFSEILSYYESGATEQFIEIYNDADYQISMDGCSIKYKNKKYSLSGIMVPGAYYAYSPEGFTLTKNPTSQNDLYIIDEDGSVVDSLTYYNGQKKGVAMAQFGYNADGSELWLPTYAPTPGEENNYQKYKTCESGKVINEETGNCVKASSIDSSLEACPEGKYRNPLTGRCKSYDTSSSSTLKECADGYERNPETNRCRKIKTNTGADWALDNSTTEVQVNFAAITAIIIVVMVGMGYVIWQFRKEIQNLVKKMASSLRKKRK